MAQLLLVNPSKRKKTMARKPRRTPKQIAATKKLVALNKRRARAKRKPAAKRRTPAVSRVMRNGRKRTPKAQTRYVARRKANTVKRYYANPARRTRKSMIANVVDKQIKPAAIMASGALLMDVGYGYLGGYIPAVLNTGMARHATKGVLAVGLSYLVGNFVKQATANEMAKGALTVTMHDALKEAMQNFMPGIPLGYYNASPVYGGDMGYFSNDSGSGYSDDSGMGYFSTDSGTGFHNMNQPTPFDSSTIE